MNQHLAELRKTLNRHPLDPNTMLAMANALVDEQQIGIAYHLLRRGASVSKSLEMLVNYGRTLMLLAAHAGDENWLDTAEEVLRDATTQFPESADALGMLGTLYVQKGSISEGEELLHKALDINPELVGAMQGISTALFYRQQWGEAFDWLEQAIAPPMRFIPDVPPVPYWDGARGKKLLVVGEQGIGDEISFASMIPDAAQDNEVTFWCTRKLESLFARSMPNVNVRGIRPTKYKDAAMFFGDFVGGEVDAKCLVASLGCHYRRNTTDFPRKGFLVADPVRRAEYRAVLDTLPGKKVGIAWTGGMAPSYWHRRGLTEADLATLMDVPGVSWVSLQYQRGCPPGVTEFKEVVDIQESYDETAALVMELDAVVTVTTAIAHLCGALGRRAHVLVNEIPRWFYGLEGRDHAWYDSLVLHRQVDGVWPIEELKAELAEEFA